MVQSQVTDSDILAILNNMRSKPSAVRHAAVRFSVGQHVRIRKEKLKFVEGGEQNYTTEIFRIRKVVLTITRPVYELQDLLGKNIDGQIYAAELSPVLVTKNTTYEIDKILRTRTNRGTLEYLVRWRA